MFNNFKIIGRILIIAAIALFLPIVTFAQEDLPEGSEPVAIDTEADDVDEAGDIELEDEDEDEDAEVEDDDEGEGPPEGRGKPEGKEKRGQGLDRRSAVANAVHELLEIADRSGGIGKQIREIAREHNESNEKAEESLEKAKKRGKVAKFFIGPDYKQLKKVEENLEEHNKRFAELEQLRAKLESKEDSQLAEKQMEVLEQSRNELKEEMKAAKKGFSLLGWLNRLLSK